MWDECGRLFYVISIIIIFSNRNLMYLNFKRERVTLQLLSLDWLQCFKRRHVHSLTVDFDTRNKLSGLGPLSFGSLVDLYETEQWLVPEGRTSNTQEEDTASSIVKATFSSHMEIPITLQSLRKTTNPLWVYSAVKHTFIFSWKKKCIKNAIP